MFEHSDDIDHTVFGFDGAYPQQGHWQGYFEGWTLDQQRGFGDHGYTRQHKYLDLYRVDLDTAKPTLVAKGAGHQHSWTIGADGNIAAHSEFAPATGEWVLYAGAERSKELLRKVQAAQYVASHPNEVCPAKWTPGAHTLTPSLDLIGKI